MKKFLTVLLALSVVFTYTVGTAFAASSDAYPAKERVKTVTLGVYADMKKLVDKATVSDVKIDKAAWESTYTAYETKLLGDIEARYNEIVAKIDLSASSEADIYEMFFETTHGDQYTEYTGNYKTGLYTDKTGTAATVANSLEDKTYNDEAAFNADPQTKYNASGDVVTTFVADSSVTTMTVKVKKADVKWYEKGAFTFTTAALPRTAYAMLTAFQTAEADAAARYQFNTEKAAALSVLANVNLSEFSTTIETINGVETSYNTLAKKVVETATKTVNETTIASDAKIGTVKTALEAIGEVAKLPYDKTKNETAGTGALKAIAEKYDINGYATGSYVLSKVAKDANNLKTLEDQGGDAAKLEAKKAELISTLAQKAAAYYSTAVNTPNATVADIAAAKALKDAYVTAWTYVINSATKENELPTAASMTIATGDKYAENVAAIAELEQYAAKCKAETDISGNLVRDAKLVDEKVAEYKLAAYKLTTAWDNGTPTGALATAKDAIKKIKTAPAIDEYDRADQIAALETAYANLDLYDVELAKAKAEYDAKIAALKAATTAAEYTAAKAMTITAQPSKTTVEANIAALSSFSTETARLDAYIKLLEAGQVGKANADKVDYGKFTTAYWKVFYAENGARTSAEVTALYDKAKADIDATKTNGALATAKNAAEAAIAALPAQITEANADAVKAAYAAAAAYAKDCKVADYKASDLSNKAKLTDDITKLANAERNAVQLAFDKLPVDALITDADKAAIKAVAESKAAFNKKIAEEDMYKDAGITTESTVNTEAKLLKIRGLELAKVKAAIDAIPINVTLKDKATVEAARALVDAYIAEYTTYDTKNIYGAKYDAAKAITNSEDLTSAEAAIKVLDKEAKINATQSLKLKASSKLYKGKKIRVNWRVADGDASVIDGYQVYKSTKANSGYKYMGKTTKSYMDNKKSLKKGTRYFYKVRAYVDVDGTRYYSDWSNKANRIYKK